MFTNPPGYTRLNDTDTSATPYHAMSGDAKEHVQPLYQPTVMTGHPAALSLKASPAAIPPVPPVKDFLTGASADPSVLEQPLFSELKAIVTEAHLAHEESLQQAANVIAAFNKNVKTSAVTTTIMWGRGARLNPNEFMLVHRNKVPELVGFNKEKIATIITGPGTVVGAIKKVQQNAPQFGAHGSHVINVPQGKYAKVWRGNKPVLLGEGPHVIHDVTLKFAGNEFNPEHDFIDQNPASNYISHGSINIVRVPPGQLAKITIQGKQFILPHRAEPYAFNVLNFQFAGLVNQASEHIDHGNIHIIRVPQGKYAKITISGQAQLLKPRAEPYVYNTPYFEWKNFVNLTDNYIGHGNKHILRVPPGKVAKVTVDGRPYLLESQKEPYEFDTLYFNLVGDRNERGEVSCFEDATSRLITNGNLKRLIPRTGEVAVSYDNGKLKIISPSEDQQPIMITSPTHDVDPDFLPIGIKTLIFPSEDTKKEKRKDNSKATEDEIAYEVFTTKDSMRVGVKLMVAYEIFDPALALRRLVSRQGILEHIENCAVVDMGKAIQRCSSQEFLTFYQTKPRQGEEKGGANNDIPSAPPAEHFQDEVKNQLSGDLAEYGIKLVRLNIETPKVLDETIAKEMGSQSIATAKASAKEATLDTNFAIARREAEQAAEVARIKQNQENQSKISAAQTTFQATKLTQTADIEAQAAVMETANRIAINKATTDLAAAKLRAQVVETESKANNDKVRLEGERLHVYPELLQLELAKIQFAALAQTKPVINLNVTSEEMLKVSALTNPFSLFGAGLARQVQGVQPAAGMQPVPNSPRSQRLFSTVNAGGGSGLSLTAAPTTSNPGKDTQDKVSTLVMK